jgi:antitoxin ParD1/3/4
MTKAMTLNVRLSGRLGEFVTANVASDGAYENVSEYVRDLIRRDMTRSDDVAFERLKAELQLAFAAPDESYQVLDAETVIARGRQRSAR